MQKYVAVMMHERRMQIDFNGGHGKSK